MGSGMRVLILECGADEYVPDSVDKEALVERWTKAMTAGGVRVDAGTAVVENATHNLSRSDEATREDAYRRVVTMLRRIERS